MLNELFSRRSVRKYQARPIEPEKLTELLRAAMNAPSARNTRSWRFLVVEDRESLDAMVSYSPYTTMMKGAQAAILVLGDRESEPSEEYLYVNCAAAIENLLIEAVHQGLGACWCGVAPSKERVSAFRTAFRLAPALLPVGVVALGYPAEERPRVDQYDPSKVAYWRK